MSVRDIAGNPTMPHAALTSAAPTDPATLACPTARAVAHAAQPHAPVRTRRPRETCAAQPHAPIRRPADPAATNLPPQAPAPALLAGTSTGCRPMPPRAATQSPPVTAAPQPHAPDHAAAPPALASLGLSGPLAPERAGDAHAAALCHAPRHAPLLGLSEPLAPEKPRHPKPPHRAIASLLTALAANLHALERTAEPPPPPPTRTPSRSRAGQNRADQNPMHQSPCSRAARNLLHLIPLHRRPSTAPRVIASNASSAAATAPSACTPPACTHDPVPRCRASQWPAVPPVPAFRHPRTLPRSPRRASLRPAQSVRKPT